MHWLPKSVGSSKEGKFKHAGFFLHNPVYPLIISAFPAGDVPQQRFGRVFALNPGMREERRGTRSKEGRRDEGRMRQIMQNNGGIVRMKAGQAGWRADGSLALVLEGPLSWE